MANKEKETPVKEEETPAQEEAQPDPKGKKEEPPEEGVKYDGGAIPTS